MKSIYVLHSQITYPEGEVKCISLGEFFSQNPEYAILIKRTNVFPSIEALNELFAKGKSDAGMSGMFSWDPFSIDHTDYIQLKEWIEKENGFVYGEDPCDDGTMKGWFKVAMRMKRKK